MRLLRILRRFAVVLVAAAFACGAAPAAGDPSAKIARGVRVGDVVLTGLTSMSAREALRDALAAPLVLTADSQARQAPRRRFLTSADIASATREALGAEPGTNVTLRVGVDEDEIRAFAAKLAPHYARKPRNAAVADLDDELRPTYTPGAHGRRVDRPALERAIRKAVVTGRRDPVALPFVGVKPAVTLPDLSPVIVIRRESKTLTVYQGRKAVRTFRIATGQWQYPTPLGRFELGNLQRDPWWYPPPSDWAKGLEPVPPGPGNPLGTRWMGFAGGSLVGIHGTPDAASIGYSASHGCIRMHVPDAEWLFERVRVGTVVFVVSA